MFGFFYSLVVSLFNGSWSSYSTYDALRNFGNGISHLFSSLSYFFQGISLEVHTEGLTDYQEIIDTYNNVSNTLSTSTQIGLREVIMEGMPDIIGGIISTIVVIGLILAVITIIKRIFTIFFQGVR